MRGPTWTLKALRGLKYVVLWLQGLPNPQTLLDVGWDQKLSSVSNCAIGKKVVIYNFKIEVWDAKVIINESEDSLSL